MAGRIMLLVVGLLFLQCSAEILEGGILYPRESESREVRSLDGIWDFRLADRFDPDVGFREKWYKQRLSETGPVQPMPVPSSYNDITQNSSIRDHIGWAWYDTEFFIPKRWLTDNQRVFLRFGSAHYNTRVWVNSVTAVNHTGGHLPFVAEVTKLLHYGTNNRVTVTINNTLTPHTVPQGHIVHENDPKRYPPGYFYQTLNFDFFNFAGIHRPVYLYTTPQNYVDDITVTTDINGTTGVVNYVIAIMGASGNDVNPSKCLVVVYDKNGRVVGEKMHSSLSVEGQILIDNANLWWPYQMHSKPAYLYTLSVTVLHPNGEDVYRLPFGIRTIDWSATSFLINGKPFYFRGFGRHEDFHILGKGVDYPLIVKDYNLLKWVGANSYRTSHYPYAEEILDQADRQGIVIINESPAIGLNGFDKTLLKQNLKVMSEFVRRDKNRPSVVIWSIGNEPQSQKNASGPYFKAVVEHTKSLDPTRPVTLVLSQHYQVDKAAPYLDIIGINRYFSWYSDTGHLEVIHPQTLDEVYQWHHKFKKPIIMTEYGAGTVSGMHMDPPFVWTEDYQVALLLQNFKAFDILRHNTSLGFIGEMIWNFADFATPQEYIRPWGCMKGVFTRERQPKAAAHVVRWRYWHVANETSGIKMPADLKFWWHGEN